MRAGAALTVSPAVPAGQGTCLACTPTAPPPGLVPHFPQVGTSDGRVVLIGRPGVEATLRSASRSPTKHLCFLPNKGALLRVTQDGDIQLFSAVSRRLLTSIWLQVRQQQRQLAAAAAAACRDTHARV